MDTAISEKKVANDRWTSPDTVLLDGKGEEVIVFRCGLPQQDHPVPRLSY